MAYMTLNRGARGPAVQKLQAFLAQWQVKRSRAAKTLAVDGVFGSETLAVVQALQRAAGLTADGIVGPKTWAALENALGMSINITAQEFAQTTWPVTAPPVAPITTDLTQPEPTSGSGWKWLGLGGAVVGALAYFRRRRRS